MRQQKLYDTEYILDEQGRVWSPFKKDFLRLSTNAHGYAYTTISAGEGHIGIIIHRAVWKAFKGAIPKGGLRHKDSNKMNPALENLEPVHPGWEYINYIKQGITITKLAAYYELPKKTISKVVSELVPGGIRSLRKQYPLNKSKDIHELSKSTS
jgi:hypothetical protein